jgi:RNA polymerase sigma-70 factor (ECF subfamily)
MPEALAVEESRLIDRCLAGDRAAARELVRRHQDAVYTLGLRMLGRPEAAEDLVQDVFLSVFKNLHRFQRRSRLRTWIYRVAVNRALNWRSSAWYRRWRRSQSLDGTESGERSLAERLPAARPGPEELAEGMELRELLEAELRALPEVFRVAVILRDIEGLGYAEIAEVLGVREGTVKSRINRGRELLRRRLAPHLSAGGGRR